MAEFAVTDIFYGQLISDRLLGSYCIRTRTGICPVFCGIGLCLAGRCRIGCSACTVMRLLVFCCSGCRRLARLGRWRRCGIRQDCAGRKRCENPESNSSS